MTLCLGRVPASAILTSPNTIIDHQRLRSTIGAPQTEMRHVNFTTAFNRGGDRNIPFNDLFLERLSLGNAKSLPC